MELKDPSCEPAVLKLMKVGIGKLLEFEDTLREAKDNSSYQMVTFHYGH